MRWNETWVSWPGSTLKQKMEQPEPKPPPKHNTTNHGTFVNVCSCAPTSSSASPVSGSKYSMFLSNLLGPFLSVASDPPPPVHLQKQKHLVFLCGFCQTKFAVIAPPCTHAMRALDSSACSRKLIALSISDRFFLHP